MALSGPFRELLCPRTFALCARAAHKGSSGKMTAQIFVLQQLISYPIEENNILPGFVRENMLAYGRPSGNLLL